MLSIHCVTHLAVFRFEIVCLEKSFTVYQADTCRQAHRTNEANFTCPLGYQTSIFTFPRSTVVCPGQWNLGFFLPCMTYYQSFLSFNCIISECGQLSLHMKSTAEVLCYRLRFSHEFVTQHCLLLIIRDSEWNEQIMLISKRARML